MVIPAGVYYKKKKSNFKQPHNATQGIKNENKSNPKLPDGKK